MQFEQRKEKASTQRETHSDPHLQLSCTSAACPSDEQTKSPHAHPAPLGGEEQAQPRLCSRQTPRQFLTPALALHLTKRSRFEITVLRAGLLQNQGPVISFSLVLRHIPAGSMPEAEVTGARGAAEASGSHAWCCGTARQRGPTRREEGFAHGKH